MAGPKASHIGHTVSRRYAAERATRDALRAGATHRTGPFVHIPILLMKPRAHAPHHRISLAAVLYDAMAIRKRLLSKKITKCAAHVAPPGSLPA